MHVWISVHPSCSTSHRFSYAFPQSFLNPSPLCFVLTSNKPRSFLQLAISVLHFRRYLSKFDSMPARSVLLNVSITARGLGKANVVEEVREYKAEEQSDMKVEGVEEVKRLRVDSATADTTPSITTPLTVATACNTPPMSIDYLPTATDGNSCHHTTPLRVLTNHSPRVRNLPPTHQIRRLSPLPLQSMHFCILLFQGLPATGLAVAQAQLRPSEQSEP